MGNAEAVSHPAQAKYGACKAKQKNGSPCGPAIVRDGLCAYHQTGEVIRRLLAKLEKNERERQAIVEQLRKLP